MAISSCFFNMAIKISMSIGTFKKTLDLGPKLFLHKYSLSSETVLTHLLSGNWEGS